MNLRRRHLNASQRAMVAAELATLGEGRPSKTPQIQGVSTEQAAKLLNVGHSSVETAKVVKRDAAPEIIDMVVGGELAVSGAAALAKLPADEGLQPEPLSAAFAADAHAAPANKRPAGGTFATGRVLTFASRMAAPGQFAHLRLSRYSPTPSRRFS